MNWKISILLLTLILSACKGEKASEANTREDSSLIEVDELKTIMNQSNIKILDFRKKEKYDKEHIEGALHIWRTDIEDGSYPYGGIMASASQIETLFGKLGVTSEDTIIVYDDIGLCNAARIWWLLQNYEFKKVKLLHGGLNAWKGINGKVSSEIPTVKETVFKLKSEPEMQLYISKEEVSAALKGNSLILDTRTSDEYSGKRQKKGALKGGRIPNSVHIDWADAIDYDGDKRLRPFKDLEKVFKKLNRKINDTIIVYCHSGVRSAHTTFVLTQLLGYKNVKNYDGSWTEWSYFKDLPVENDSITVIKK